MTKIVMENSLRPPIGVQDAFICCRLLDINMEDVAPFFLFGNNSSNGPERASNHERENNGHEPSRHPKPPDQSPARLLPAFSGHQGIVLNINSTEQEERPDGHSLYLPSTPPDDDDPDPLFPPASLPAWFWQRLGTMADSHEIDLDWAISLATQPENANRIVYRKKRSFRHGVIVLVDARLGDSVFQRDAEKLIDQLGTFVGRDRIDVHVCPPWRHVLHEKTRPGAAVLILACTDPGAITSMTPPSIFLHGLITVARTRPIANHPVTVLIPDHAEGYSEYFPAYGLGRGHTEIWENWDQSKKSDTGRNHITDAAVTKFQRLCSSCIHVTPKLVRYVRQRFAPELGPKAEEEFHKSEILITSSSERFALTQKSTSLYNDCSLHHKAEIQQIYNTFGPSDKQINRIKHPNNFDFSIPVVIDALRRLEFRNDEHNINIILNRISCEDRKYIEPFFDPYSPKHESEDGREYQHYSMPCQTEYRDNIPLRYLEIEPEAFSIRVRLADDRRPPKSDMVFPIEAESGSLEIQPLQWLLRENVTLQGNRSISVSDEWAEIKSDFTPTPVRGLLVVHDEKIIIPYPTLLIIYDDTETKQSALSFAREIVAYCACYTAKLDRLPSENIWTHIIYIGNYADGISRIADSYGHDKYFYYSSNDIPDAVNDKLSPAWVDIKDHVGFSQILIDTFRKRLVPLSQKNGKAGYPDPRIQDLIEQLYKGDNTKVFLDAKVWLSENFVSPYWVDVAIAALDCVLHHMMNEIESAKRENIKDILGPINRWIRDNAKAADKSADWARVFCASMAITNSRHDFVEVALDWLTTIRATASVQDVFNALLSGSDISPKERNKILDRLLDWLERKPRARDWHSVAAWILDQAPSEADGASQTYINRILGMIEKAGDPIVDLSNIIQKYYEIDYTGHKLIVYELTKELDIMLRKHRNDLGNENNSDLVQCGILLENASLDITFISGAIIQHVAGHELQTSDGRWLAHVIRWDGPAMLDRGWRFLKDPDHYRHLTADWGDVARACVEASGQWTLVEDLLDQAIFEETGFADCMAKLLAVNPPTDKIIKKTLSWLKERPHGNQSWVGLWKKGVFHEDPRLKSGTFIELAIQKSKTRDDVPVCWGPVVLALIEIHDHGHQEAAQNLALAWLERLRDDDHWASIHQILRKQRPDLVPKLRELAGDWLLRHRHVARGKAQVRHWLMEAS